MATAVTVLLNVFFKKRFEKIRDMNLSKCHFIPSGLTKDADRLVERHDMNLEDFRRYEEVKNWI